jgi:hypothetical protein
MIQGVEAALPPQISAEEIKRIHGIGDKPAYDDGRLCAHGGFR